MTAAPRATDISSSSERTGVLEEHFSVQTSDDWQIAATHFAQSEVHSELSPKSPIVLISGAAGVPRGFYRSFAKYLVSEGARAAVTYDYRGISQSAGDQKRWPELRMKDWALVDLPAVVSWILERHSDTSLVGMGHSYGGQALGLSGIADQFDRFATVATMSGYWRDLDTPWSVWFQTQVLGRSIANLLGYVPKIVSPGETFPGQIFIDWANWIRNPDYFFDDKSLAETQNFANVSLPLMSIGVTDDPWGTEKAIGAFMSHYTKAERYQCWISPTDSGPIGHLGFFRKKHQSAHWGFVKDFLLEGTIPATIRNPIS